MASVGAETSPALIQDSGFSMKSGESAQNCPDSHGCSSFTSLLFTHSKIPSRDGCKIIINVNVVGVLTMMNLCLNVKK